MESVSAFFDRNIDVVFFFYGLAFFSMGFAVWLEVGRVPADRTAKAFLYLAAFGMLHGFHEWFEIFLSLRWEEAINSVGLLFLESLRVILLSLSFLLLFIFGLQLTHANDEKPENGHRSTTVWAVGLMLLWLFAVVLVFTLQQPCDVDCLGTADVLSRYLLAIPASLLAAWAMLSQRKTYQLKGMPNCARDITWAAVALILYGVVGQLFTRETFLFPSNMINAQLFRHSFGIPIQLFRGLMAAIVAIFVIRAMRSFELERRQSLAAAKDARLAAQRESLEFQRKAQAETEQLNLELQEAFQDLTMLFELSRGLASTLDPDILLKQAISRIYESVPRIRGGMIMLREGEGQSLSRMAAIGYEQDSAYEKISEVTARQATEVAEAVVNTGHSYCWTGTKLIPAQECSCMTGVPDADQLSSDSGDRTMGMPLLIRDRVAGSLVLSVDGDATWLTARDLSLIQTIASQLSIAIANATLYQEVQARDELRGELLHQIVSAQELERQGIARDLHDGAGQMATALGMGLAAASGTLRSDPELAERQLSELKRISGQLIHELQGLISGLRPSVLDDLGLVPALQALVKEFRARTGIATELTITGSVRRIKPDLETIVFRIAQEGLTNVYKHAQASTVRMAIDFTKNAVGLRIQDDGRGFNPQDVFRSDMEKQWGLVGIRERVALVGGSCAIDAWPGEGTTIQVSIPISEGGSDD